MKHPLGNTHTHTGLINSLKNIHLKRMIICIYPGLFNLRFDFRYFAYNKVDLYSQQQRNVTKKHFVRMQINFQANTQRSTWKRNRNQICRAEWIFNRKWKKNQQSNLQYSTINQTKGKEKKKETIIDFWFMLAHHKHIFNEVVNKKKNSFIKIPSRIYRIR